MWHVITCLSRKLMNEINLRVCVIGSIILFSMSLILVAAFFIFTFFDFDKKSTHNIVLVFFVKIEVPFTAMTNKNHSYLWPQF